MEPNTGVVLVLGVLVSGSALFAVRWVYDGEGNMLRLLVAAVTSGVYAALCLQPVLFSWGGMLWRMVSFVLAGALAFGRKKGQVALYLILATAIDGLTIGIGEQRPLAGVAAAFIITLICAAGFGKDRNKRKCVPVELVYKGRSVRVTALRDTGNLLADPISGDPVIVVDAKVAEQLTGLGKQQLCDPLDTVRARPIPGLRLISYRTVGQTGGLLLAVSAPYAKIGKHRKPVLVAFSPEELSDDGEYEALIGGTV